jgi:glutaconate CoA-transferase subunit A
MDKRLSEADVISEIRDGMTIGFGGWGSRRKPMSIVKEMLRSDLRDLTVVAYGGPEVGMLCAAGKVKKVIYGFVSLDTIPLEPNFRAARQDGTIEAMELDEGMLQWGLRAAAYRLPFLPLRAGPGSSVMENTPELKTVTSPYPDGEELVAMPAVHLDVALVHANRADARGNAQYLGHDWYFDDWFCMAAERAYVSAEKIVATDDFWSAGDPQTVKIPRMHVTGVVEAPGGARFTSNPPDYQRDEELQRTYATTPWAEFADEWLNAS